MSWLVLQMQFDRLRRRDFITLLGGAAAWPLAARAQQRERMRRIGVLMNLAADDTEAQARLAAFQQGLEKLGWSEGRNVHLDVRFALPTNVNLARPGSNLTGLTMYEGSVGGKWLAMLKEIDPRVTRAAFIINPKS